MNQPQSHMENHGQLFCCFNKARLLWDRWTRPHRRFTTPEAQKKARLLASLTLALVITTIGVLSLAIALRPESLLHGDNLLFYVGTSLLVVAYVFNQRGYYSLAAKLTLFTSTTVTMFAPFMPNGFSLTMFITILAVLHSAFIYSPRTSVYIMLAMIVGLALLINITPNIIKMDYIYALLFVVVIDSIVLAFMFHQQKVEDERNMELREIAQKLENDIAEKEHAERYLQVSNLELEDLVSRRTVLLENQNRELESAHARLQELDHLKDGFISSISHEMRTPISNLKLYHHLMQKRPENHATYMETMGSIISHLEELIEGILSLSRAMRALGEQTLLFLPFEKLIGDIVKAWEPLAERRNLKLWFHVEGKLPFILGDQTLLKHAVNAILKNAVNYTSSPGAIEVVVALKTEHEKKWAVLTVRNSGPAIPENELNNLGDRFFRGAVALELGVPGIGLGLAVSREIIVQHGGRIEVTGKDESLGGPAFTVLFPVR